MTEINEIRVRVSAAGIIFNQGKVLLVRYSNNQTSFLLGPGGGVLHDEDILTGLKREVFEETGLHVIPGRLILIEDLVGSKYRVMKVWFLCTVTGGELRQTKEAEIEGITEAAWFDKAQLKNETVYPEILKTVEWEEILSFEAQCLPMKKARF